jgi:hypothetical protein
LRRDWASVTEFQGENRMRITESQLRRIVRQEILREGAPAVVWEEGRMGKKHYVTPSGTYTWEPSKGYLTFFSKRDGRLTVLSYEISSKRSGGFHNVVDQASADSRVLGHMRHTRIHRRKMP